MKAICWGRLVSFLALTAFSSAAQTEHRGIVLDDTTRHVVVPGGFTPANLAAAERDPRVWMLLQLHQNQLRSPYAGISGTDPTIQLETTSGVVEPTVSTDVQGKAVPQSGSTPVDWSVPLGSGSLLVGQWPAKYGFNPDSTPSCSDDYVVFGLDVAGVTGGQANLVGINQLYSGSNPTGICGTTPHVNWAYNGSTAGGKILTSPALSLDGTKVAYVESASGSSILHILTWKAGQGISATDAAKPTLVGSCTSTSSCLASVTYSTTSTTTLASIYPDYSSADKGYVASDDGKIYRISCLFHCALNANPTVDWVFTLPVAGTGGAKPVPTMPIYDGSTYVFVADQLGEVWSIDVSGASPVLAGKPLMIGGGGCTTTDPPGRTGTTNPCNASGGSYGVPDGVMIVTGTDEEVFAVSGNDGTENASAVVVEMNPTLTTQVRDSIGIGSVGNTTTDVNLYLGSFDNAFWNDPAEGHFYVCGTGKTTATSTQPWDYWIGFTDYPTMSSTPTQAPYVNIPISGAACTDLEEMYNTNIDLGGNDNDHDMLLGGVIDPTYGPLILDDVSDGSIAEPDIANALFPGGVSNFVIDNISTDAQASSWYFATLKATSNVTGCSSESCAVKVHQSNLQ